MEIGSKTGKRDIYILKAVWCTAWRYCPLPENKPKYKGPGPQNARMSAAEREEGRTKVMSDKVIENNQVSVIGEIVSGFTFSHEAVSYTHLL